MAGEDRELTISIADGANGLVYSAKKAGVLWLTGNVSVCLSGNATQITLKDTKATSNVPALARLALPSTQSAQIVNGQIKLGGRMGRNLHWSIVAASRPQRRKAVQDEGAKLRLSRRGKQCVAGRLRPTFHLFARQGVKQLLND
jgi:hypothetical protein